MEIRRPAQSEDPYYTRLEHLVDTQGMSYEKARAILGDIPSEEEAPVIKRSRQTRQPRRRSGHGPQYGEEEGTGYPDGLPHYYQPFEPLSPEQLVVNKRGIAAARKALKAARTSNQ